MHESSWSLQAPLWPGVVQRWPLYILILFTFRQRIQRDQVLFSSTTRLWLRSSSSDPREMGISKTENQYQPRPLSGPFQSEPRIPLDVASFIPVGRSPCSTSTDRLVSQVNRNKTRQKIHSYAVQDPDQGYMESKTPSFAIKHP